MLVRKSTNLWKNSSRFLLLKLQTLTVELKKQVVIPWDLVLKEPTSWRRHQYQWLMSSLWIQLRRRKLLLAGRNPKATKQLTKGLKQRLSKRNPNFCQKSTLSTGNQLLLTKSFQRTLTSHPRFSKSVIQYNLEVRLSTRSLDKTQKECSKPKGDSMNSTHYERLFTIDGQVAISLTAQTNLLWISTPTRCRSRVTRMRNLLKKDVLFSKDFCVKSHSMTILLKAKSSKFLREVQVKSQMSSTSFHHKLQSRF